MVLFENINVNQRVEVLRDGQIYSGTVKYKGSINGISGEWVGIELELPGTYLYAVLEELADFSCLGTSVVMSYMISSKCDGVLFPYGPDWLCRAV